MIRTRMVVLAMFTYAQVIAGCNPGVIILDAGNDGAAHGDGTSGEDEPGLTTGTVPAASTSGTGVATFGDDTSDDGLAFIVESDFGPVCSTAPGSGYLAHCACDVLAQDCPAGNKCVAWASDGGSYFNANRCVPIARDPAAIGESCTVEGSPQSGVDDCDIGGMCWGVDADTLEGTCVPLCTDGVPIPLCPDDLTCSVAGYGAVTTCLPPCDPLVAACPFGEACVLYGGAFVCTPPLPEAGSLGESCSPEHGCGQGLVCVDGPTAGCGEAGCCVPLCTIEDDDCPNAETSCIAPDGLPEGFGACLP